MKKIHLFTSIVAWFSARAASAASPGAAFTYQGRLTDGGAPAHGNYV